LAAAMMFLFCSHGVKGRQGYFGDQFWGTNFERVAPRLLSTFLDILLERNAGSRVIFSGWAVAWGNIVVSKNYLTRQATTLVKFAQSTSDPKVLTALVEKASELKSQADQTRQPSDLSPKAPDVEIPTN
jgi:predicted membrane chloride channel (bestrophin family)